MLLYPIDLVKLRLPAHGASSLKKVVTKDPLESNLCMVHRIVQIEYFCRLFDCLLDENVNSEVNQF
jgi:hypothetical protein